MSEGVKATVWSETCFCDNWIAKEGLARSSRISATYIGGVDNASPAYGFKTQKSVRE
jgi:hypothetical protein